MNPAIEAAAGFALHYPCAAPGSVPGNPVYPTGSYIGQGSLKIPAGKQFDQAFSSGSFLEI